MKKREELIVRKDERNEDIIGKKEGKETEK